MSINLRRHWKLVATSVVLTVATLVTIGDWRVSAVSSGGASAATATYDITNDTDLMDDSVVHTIEITYDQEDFTAMRILYEEDGTKEWVRADITIDGVTIEDVGIRLKGNSTLFSLSGKGPGGVDLPDGVTELPGGIGPEQIELSWDVPEELPFLVRFDEFVADRTYQGLTQVAVRIGGGSTLVSDLAEALGYAAVEAAGAPAVRGAYAVVSVNGSEEALHFVVETIDDLFAASRFSGDGVVYKALATGSFDYLGEDPTLYVDSFDQVTGVNRHDLAPLIRLLEFINNASDEDFAAHLHEYVDVDSFATYVALQSLIINVDDIAGLGNNAYLWYDLDTELFTVISWDLNHAFSGSYDLDPTVATMMDPIFPGGDPPAGLGLPEGLSIPEGIPLPDGLPSIPTGGNVLKERFLAEPVFAEVYGAAFLEVYEAVYSNGFLSEELDRLAKVIDGVSETLGLSDQSPIEEEVITLRGLMNERAEWLSGFW